MYLGTRANCFAHTRCGCVFESLVCCLSASKVAEIIKVPKCLRRGTKSPWGHQTSGNLKTATMHTLASASHLNNTHPLFTEEICFHASCKGKKPGWLTEWRQANILQKGILLTLGKSYNILYILGDTHQKCHKPKKKNST